MNSYRSLFFILFLLIISCDKGVEIINQPPIARIIAHPTSGSRPLEVSFDGTKSTDPDEDSLLYQWRFDDGSSATLPVTTKTYTESGEFLVRLIVSDSKGLQNIAEVSINVDEPPDIFPMVENAQWAYKIKYTKSENGVLAGTDEGITYVTVKNLDNSSSDVQYMTLRVTGERHYLSNTISEKIMLAHSPGQKISFKHTEDGDYTGSFLFSAGTITEDIKFGETSIDLGTFEGFSHTYENSNWGENYVSERYEYNTWEFFNNTIGMIAHTGSSYIDFLDCWYCPVYTGSNQAELIGYYVYFDDNNILHEGTGINPDNPFGGDLGMITFFAEEDFGTISINLDGEYVGSITTYFPGGVTCGDYNACNVSRPPSLSGSYQLDAESNQGYQWEGSVDFESGVCKTIRFIVTSANGRTPVTIIESY